MNTHQEDFKMKQGINLAFPTYYTSGSEYTNLVKLSGKIVPINDTVLTFDNQDYVSSVSPNTGEWYRGYSFALGNAEQSNYKADSILIFAYKGTGHLRIDGGKITNTVVQGEWTLATFTPLRDGLMFCFSAIDTSNYPRDFFLCTQENIQYLNAHIKGEPYPIFNPQYLEKLKPFSVLRFMDMLHTNDWPNPNKEFKDFASFEGRTWTTEHGVPLKVLTELCNQTNCDMWINIPPEASLNCIIGMANFIKSNLHSNLRVYVEYSNECWNRGFKVTQWLATQAELLIKDPIPDPNLKFMALYAQKSNLAIAAFKRTFLHTPERILGVLNWQCGTTYLVESVMFKYCPHVDVLAVAPYFGWYFGETKNKPILQQWMDADPTGNVFLDNLFIELADGGLLTPKGQGGVAQMMHGVSADQALVQKRQLGIAAYEAGQSLTISLSDTTSPYSKQLQAYFVQAQNDPRMGELYTRLATEWNTVTGGALMNWFNFININSIYGYWGLLTGINEESSAKYDAVKRLVDPKQN